MCHCALAPLLCQQFSEQEDTGCLRRGTLEGHPHLFVAQGQTPLPGPLPRGEWFPQFVQFTVTLHHSTAIIPHTHQFTGMSESTNISIFEITTTSLYHLFVTTPPKLSRIMPELPVLYLMNLALCNLVNGPELPQTILILH